jgi:hypothetical protein
MNRSVQSLLMLVFLFFAGCATSMNTGRKTVSEDWKLSQVQNLVIVKTDFLSAKIIQT